MIRTLAYLIVVNSILIGSCAPMSEPIKPLDPVEPPTPNPDMPQGTRGPVYVDSTELLLLESYPVQVQLRVAGALPTPCHALKWEVESAEPSGRIDVTLYSLSDPDLACIQVLEAFEVGIPLGSFEAGDFTVYLNGDRVGDIEL